MRQCVDGSSGVGMLEKEDTVIVTLEAQDPAGMEAAVRAANASPAQLPLVLLTTQIV